jgi:hypothetical protein
MAHLKTFCFLKAPIFYREDQIKIKKEVKRDGYKKYSTGMGI